MGQCRSPIPWPPVITAGCERVHKGPVIPRHAFHSTPPTAFQLQQQDPQQYNMLPFSPLEGVFCACAPPS
ncbi:hypothetical protein PVAP13_1NG257500 [Panicum virgatum]|uniref:Uncharacterized protein n=1 Tax=Panicum virgatum TaxID=38727 RepID=A0A8T0X6T6_PANVG|nr:hypothetical protein PVAP13_1NG257500 [Panicum virgatum]